MKWTSGRILASAVALSAAIGCSSDEGDDPKDGGTSGDGDEETEVEMISWWIGPGEAEALQALFNVHEERNPGATIFNATAESGVNTEEVIAQRLADGDPPDLFQENVFDLPIMLAENPDILEPLDELFDKNGWKEAFLPEVIEQITIDGRVYAMPVGIHRENTLFYNQAIFTEHGLDAPTSIAELWEVCEALTAEGITPIATGYQGWILRIMFHSIAMGTMGAAEYAQFFTGEGDPDDPALRESIQNLQRILEDYVHEDMKVEEFGWQEASQALFDGEAAMFYHGDWAGGYVQQLGWEAGTDYSAVTAPGAEEVFLFGVDVFAMPTGAKNPDGALAFFETVGSPEGQAAFNNIKGSTPVLLDADVSLLTPVGQETLASLKSADIVMVTPTWEAVDEAIMTFALDFDEDALVAFFQDAIY